MSGWTLPTTKQIDIIGGNGNTTYISVFSPILGGNYGNGMRFNEDTLGYWWGSEIYNGTGQYGMGYDGNVLYTRKDGIRYNGLYIRCVSEEKTVTDLMYI